MKKDRDYEIRVSVAGKQSSTVHRIKALDIDKAAELIKPELKETYGPIYKIVSIVEC